MKKNELKKLAIMGLAGGLLFTMHTQGFAQGYWGQQSQRSPYYQRGQGDQRTMQQRRLQSSMKDSRSRTHQQTQQMTEQELLSQLDQQGRALYQSLGRNGKALALQLANQTCRGENKCEGLNSCRNDENGCAGEGGCEGTSKGPFKDKSLAVRVAAKHLAQQRQKASKNMLNNGMDRIPSNKDSQQRSWFKRGN